MHNIPSFNMNYCLVHFMIILTKTNAFFIVFKVYLKMEQIIINRKKIPMKYSAELHSNKS